MVIRIYWASVTGNRKVNGDQTRLRNIIESLKLPSQWIDITTDPLIRTKMREECGKPKAMPPQIFNESGYLGEVDDMDEFIEQDRVLEWFGINDNKEGDKTLANMSTKSPEVELTNGNSKIDTSDVTNLSIISHRSPTSSIENEVPSTFENGKGDRPVLEDQLPSSRKNVLAAAGAFESLSKCPPSSVDKPRVIFTQSRSLNKLPASKEVDEERRRKILGFSTQDNSASNKDSSTAPPIR